MQELKKKIEKKLDELNDLYDYYLNMTEDYHYNNVNVNQRINDLRIEIRTYKHVLELIEND